MRVKKVELQISDNATTANLSEVCPILDSEKNLILIQEGDNNRRSWGCVSVTSTIVLKTRTFLVVHVGVSHKYRGGQGWYYYEHHPGKKLERLTASQLSNRRRKQVIDNLHHAPSWAKTPFESVKKERKKPEKVIRFKKVVRTDHGLRSIFDGSEYIIGKTRVQKARENHKGGFYVYRTAELAKEKTAFPADSVFPDTEGTEVILKCEVWGNCVIDDSNYKWDDATMTYIPSYDAKECWSYIKPVEIIK